jgi:hypothetical protein
MAAGSLCIYNLLTDSEAIVTRLLLGECTVRNLVQGGERNLWCQDWEGRSPLHYAALSGDPQHQLYNWLIQQGAPTNLKDKVNAYRCTKIVTQDLYNHIRKNLFFDQKCEWGKHKAIYDLWLFEMCARFLKWLKIVQTSPDITTINSVNIFPPIHRSF